MKIKIKLLFCQSNLNEKIIIIFLCLNLLIKIVFKKKYRIIGQFYFNL